MDNEGSDQPLAEIPAGNPKVFNEICSREEPPTPWDIKSCYLLSLLIWMNSLCPRLPFVPHILNNNQSRWYPMCCFKKWDLQNISCRRSHKWLLVIHNWSWVVVSIIQSIYFLVCLPFPTSCYHGSSKSVYCLLSFTFENCYPLRTKLTQLISFPFLCRTWKAHTWCACFDFYAFPPGLCDSREIKKAKNLKLLLTAGIGSDHIDLNAAAAAGVTVAEVTGTISFFISSISLVTALFTLWTFYYEEASAMILHNLTDGFFNNFYSK